MSSLEDELVELLDADQLHLYTDGSRLQQVADNLQRGQARGGGTISITAALDQDGRRRP